MKFKLPVYLVLILLCAAVVATFSLTYAYVGQKYQSALDAFSDETEGDPDENLTSENQTITLTGVGMELDYIASENIFVVVKVSENSEAEVSGIMLGDVIVAVNSQDITLASASTITHGDMLSIMRDIDGTEERRDTVL